MSPLCYALPPFTSVLFHTMTPSPCLPYYSLHIAKWIVLRIAEYSLGINMDGTLKIFTKNAKLHALGEGGEYVVVGDGKKCGKYVVLCGNVW